MTSYINAMQQDLLKPMILKALEIGKDLNDGHGLDVPPSLATNLKNMGITEGYTVVNLLPPAQKEQA